MAKGSRSVKGKPPGLPATPPPLPRAPGSKRRKTRAPKDRGTAAQILLDRAKRAWAQGKFHEALKTASSVLFGVGAGVAATNRPGLSTTGAVMAAVSAPLAGWADTAAKRRRRAFRGSSRDLEALNVVQKSENAEFLRRLDHEFVRRYAIDPAGVQKEFDVTPLGAARIFASSRRLRRAPDARYSTKQHESDTFYDLVRPILQVKVSQLPGAGDAREVLNHHFPKEDLRPKKPEELPEELANHIPAHLIETEPQNEEDAVALSLLAAAITRAKIKKFK